jgi:hypothetical protein
LTKYLFIIVFGAAILLTAIADEYKMRHLFNYNDELTMHLDALKSFVPASGILYYRLNNTKFSEPIIRSRFVLAPRCILIPENAGQHYDTLLLINELQDRIEFDSTQKTIWSYRDTLAQYSLINFKII